MGFEKIRQYEKGPKLRFVEYAKGVGGAYFVPIGGFSDERGNSRDCCFIPDGNYKKFLETHSKLKPKVGNIVNQNGEILGKHQGLYYYTIGQRKGLGIAHKVPLFVLGFNREKNEVIVGEESELYTKEMMVEEVNLLLVDEILEPMEVEVKTRYSAKSAKA